MHRGAYSMKGLIAMKRLSELKSYTIMQVTDKDAAFWCAMGPMFTSRQIVKELEGPMFDDDTYTWILAIDNTGKIAGFTSLTTARIDKGIVECTAAYVMPEHRRKGLYAELFKHREMLGFALGATELRGVANPISKHVFDGAGWEVVRTAGKWTHYRKVNG